jgi:hypothetical protein
MGKRGDSVIGIDGRHAFKGVSRRKKRFCVFHQLRLAREIAGFPAAQALAEELNRSCASWHGAKTALCHFDPAALLRTSATGHQLICCAALKLGNLSVLNQDCKDFVLDIRQ